MKGFMEFNIDVFTDYLAKYGVITIFIVVFLEYLNLPGFAGVIMPFQESGSIKEALTFSLHIPYPYWQVFAEAGFYT